MMDLTGRTVGQYRIVEQIGEGGMATVYKAFQPSLDRYVAIKILPPYFMHEAGFAERFEREAKAIAQLVHPNILPIYDFGREGDLSYIVMRFVDAGTLKDRMRQPMSLGEIVRIVDDLASALDYAHQKRVIHRDVKPGNVLMDDRGWVLLSDFGLAKMAEGSQALTGTGVGVGTPAYMSPEQGQGLKVDHRADIYSLGVMLYEMVVGHIPYEAETPFAIVLKHIADPLPLPRRVNPDVPEGVERVVLKAMAKSPDDRYKSASDMATALRNAVAAEPDAAARVIAPAVAARTQMAEAPVGTALVEPPATAIELEAKKAAPARPAWLWMGLGAAALILVLGAGIIFLLSSLSKEPEEPPLAETPESLAVTQPTETPQAEQPTFPSLEEAGIPLHMLTPPAKGLTIHPCPGNERQICIYEMDQPQPVERIPVNLDMPIQDGTWSPSGDRIVFSTNKGNQTDLWVTSRDGSEVHTVADRSDTNEQNPAWSPTGEWIAFHRNGTPYLVHPDGQGLTQVPLPTTFEDCMNWPAWSPDGRRLAFLLDDNHCREPRGGQSVKVALVAVEWDGTNPLRLTEWETSNPGDVRVAWSPDGQFVAYQPEEGQDWLAARSDGSGEIFSVGKMPFWWFSDFWFPRGEFQPPAAEAGEVAFGTTLENCETAKGQICLRQPDDRIQAIPIDDRFWFRDPAWSPDGQQIVVSASDQGDPYGEETDRANGNLYVLDATCLREPGTCSQTMKPLTADDENDIQAAWSPDGQWIATHRSCNLGLIRPDGSDSKILFTREEQECVLEPAWSPDSQQIAFYINLDEEPPLDVEVHVIRLDGTDDRSIWQGQVDNYPWAVTWSPDGQAVVFAGVQLDGRDHWLLIPLDGGTPTEMDYQPHEWLPEHWPQWGNETGVPPGPPVETNFHVSIEGQHSPVIPLDETRFELEDGKIWQAQSEDPLDVFQGQGVAFRGLEEGGMNPVARFRITFDQEVTLKSVTMEFLGSQNTHLRLFDAQGNEIAVMGPFHHGNVRRQEELVSVTRGREFFIEVENDVCCWFAIQSIKLKALPEESP